MSDRIRSAVALIETPDEFVLHHRPNLPGKLAYPDRIHFFGGHANQGEDLGKAVVRELGEEFEEFPEPLAVEKIWEGPFTGENKRGEPVDRQVGLFRVALRAEVALTPTEKEGGNTVWIPKTMEAVDALGDDLTPFAQKALTMVLTGKSIDE